MGKKQKQNIFPSIYLHSFLKEEWKPVEEIESKAIKNRMRKIYLDTPFAKNFYLKYGFKEKEKIFRRVRNITGKKVEREIGIEFIEFSTLKDTLLFLD